MSTYRLRTLKRLDGFIYALVSNLEQNELDYVNCISTKDLIKLLIARSIDAVRRLI